MNQQENWYVIAQKQAQLKLIAHGALVVLISLFAAFFLTFDMLQGIKLWPLLSIDLEIPGTVRGWRIAHTGGLMNGILMIAIALCFTKVSLSPSSLKFIYWSFLLTGWGNTVFYWAANFSMNRGLSVGATPYGEGEIFGAISYVAGASVMLLTVIASFMLAKSAFNALKFS